MARGAGDKEWKQENEPAKEPWVHSETLDSVMWCPWEIPETCGIVLEKAQKKLSHR